MGQSIASYQPLMQPVMPAEIADSQREFPLLARLHGPSIAPAELVAMCGTYRDAVRMCWAYRRVKRMTRAQLCAEAGLYPAHASDYLSADDEKHRRSLPGDRVAAFESVCGNTLISQWHALQARLTVLEEMQARRAA